MSSETFSMLLHTHSGSWVVMVLLFVLSVMFRKQKVTDILLKVFYLIMLGSGISMLVYLNFPALYIIKGIAGIIVIGLMEMILGRVKKGKARGGSAPLWIVWAILLTAVVLTGYGVIRL